MTQPTTPPCPDLYNRIYAPKLHRKVDIMKTKVVLGLWLLFLVLFPKSSNAVVKSTLNTTPELKANKALVFLIRPKNYIGSWRTEFIYADETFLGTLDNETFTYAYVEPGERLLWTNWTSLQMYLELAAGQTYYFQTYPDLQMVDAATGKSLIRQIQVFATPSDKEKAKSFSHIEHRYKKAQKKMVKQNYIPLDPVSAPVVSEDIVSKPRKGAVKLPENTVVKIKLLENITSGYSKAGDEIAFEVAEDVLQNNRKLISAGTSLNGVLRHTGQGNIDGIGGKLDIVIPSVAAVDGSAVPLFGQLFAHGRDNSTNNSAQVAGMGLFGLLAAKKSQAFLLAPNLFEVKSRSAVWIIPSSAKSPKSANANAVALPTLEATIKKPTIFKPESSKKLADIALQVPPEGKWENIELVKIGDIPLKKTVPSKSENAGEENVEFIFSAWEIVRYLPLMEKKNEHLLEFVGQKDGLKYRITASLPVVVK